MYWATGIGRACALYFAGLGYKTSAGVEPLLLDVTLADSVAVARAALGGEPLAGPVNNAGIAVLGPLKLVPLDAWRRQFEVNLLGLVAVTQACLPALRRGRGRIVNIGSIADLSALPGSGAYDASKFAVEGITDARRMELRRWGISVSLIEAGGVATPIYEKSLRQIEELCGQAGPEQCALYKGLLTVTREETLQASLTAVPVAAVVKTVVHAMTAHRPRTHYAVGLDAWLWLLLNLLPDRWRDWLVLSKVRD